MAERELVGTRPGSIVNSTEQLALGEMIGHWPAHGPQTKKTGT